MGFTVTDGLTTDYGFDVTGCYVTVRGALTIRRLRPGEFEVESIASVYASEALYNAGKPALRHIRHVFSATTAELNSNLFRKIYTGLKATFTGPLVDVDE
jgi:hypothetical protein